MVNHRYFLTLMAVLLLFGTANAAATKSSFVGTARSEDGQLSYTETHVLNIVDGRVQSSVTTYRDKAGTVIATLDSDYSAGPFLPSYAFVDQRAKVREGVRLQGNQVQVYSGEKSEALPRTPDMITGQGFHYYVQSMLQTLQVGELSHVQFVLPARLDAYHFRLRAIKQQQKIKTLVLEVDNVLLRIFAPRLEVDYDMSNGRLVRYYGLSNIRDASGELPTVVITYDYSML